MTPPSTSDKKKIDRDQRRLIIVVLGIVTPILITVSVLMGLGYIDTNIGSNDDVKDKFRFEKLGTYPEQLLIPNKILSGTNLFNLGLSLDEEVALVEHIYSQVEDLECMNLNWYGVNMKRQIFYNESVGKIQEVLIEIGINDYLTDESPFINFISNPVMQLYIEINCKHVWSIDKVPSLYESDAGMEPFESCMNHPFFPNKAYCNLLPKEPIQV